MGGQWLTSTENRELVFLLDADSDGAMVPFKEIKDIFLFSVVHSEGK